MGTLFLLVAFFAIFPIASWAYVFDNSTCDTSGLVVRGVDAALPWEASRVVGSSDMSGLVERGNMLARQGRQCVDPGYVPRCPGPMPCCPASYTVCCNQSGTCCPGGTICAPGGCCPSGSAFCGGDVCCPPAGQCCLQGGARCCPRSGSCCGSGCCFSDEKCCGSQCCPESGTCCGETCCTSGQTCQSGRCVSPPAPVPAPSRPNEGGDEDEPEVEVEITIEPTDPGIEYTGDWSSSGTCNNGTRTTLQVEAKFTYKFRGVEFAVSFVAKDSEVEVSVELNGVEIDSVTIPARTSPQCQMDDSWRRNFTSTDEQEIGFTFKGSPPTNGRRAAPALELGQIRYVPLPSASPRPTSPPGSSTQLNNAIGKPAVLGVKVVASAMMALTVGMYLI